MRISDWSADVCSSDLLVLRRRNPRLQRAVVGQDQQALAVAVEPTGGVHAGDVDIVGKRRARLRRPAIGELRQDAVRLVEQDQAGHVAVLLYRDPSVRSEEHTSELQSLMRTSYA